MKQFKKSRFYLSQLRQSTVLSCVPVSMAAIPADVQGTRYEEPVQILSALNIMVGDEKRCLQT